MNLIKLSVAVNCIVLAISIFAAFVNFIVRVFAYFELARQRKIRFSWLAFVPFLQFYILGRICDEFNLRKGFKTSNSFWVTFFSVGFCLPSAISHIFPKLPLFTFECFNSQVYLLNCFLFLFNFYFIYFYIDCLQVILKSYQLVFRRFFLIFLSFFVIIGLDFFASLFLFGLINKRLVYCDV